ncbi:hypothetical protein LTR84_012217 [Exophiala bonariae]|uniref:Hydantoinase/oxoprolinase n=1 Tax=Exophiala bonariae TaxID=1690606 RepID=A0AAV9NFR1_9EURO|nr:hypothetical protein LTR84_012217 [Exophiala bonariae]
MGSVSNQGQLERCRIGVDVGGTNTDAVLISLSPTQIVASHKAPTSSDVTTGIAEAVRAVIDASNVPLDAISCVIIGTTHFVNAVVQRSSSLQRVGVVRLCGGSKEGFGLGVPPFVDFPKDLRHLISTKPYFCQGGFQISGAEISPLEEAEIQEVAEKLVNDDILDVVVAGIYSPLNSQHEVEAGKILLDRMNELCTARGLSNHPRITLSHRISSLGFLARENAAILNATLRRLAERTIYGFEKAMQDIFVGNTCALYLTQNDGSVLSAADAVDLPIRTFNSGPTNSIRGGEFLWRAASTAAGQGQADREDALVVIDIGGTTSDSGLLLPNGLPRMSSVMSLVGGVRTNFALPAVESIGLGGGSIIRGEEPALTVGPDSVALELLQKALLFGGDTLTATDVVAASAVHAPSGDSPLKGLGNPDNLGHLTAGVINSAKDRMRKMIEELVDRTKVQKGDIDVLIVGGGAIVIDIGRPLSGVRAVRKVKGGEVANAVGAAISRVSGIVDTVVDTSQKSLKEAQKEVSNMAIDVAVKNGARRDTVEIAEITVLPIQYVDAKARILIRAVGELDVVEQINKRGSSVLAVPESHNLERKLPTSISRGTDEQKLHDLEAYKPNIENKEWIISILDLKWIADGCKVLGCGGGGDPYQQYLKISSILEKSPGSIRVVSPFDLPEKAMVGWTGCLGSPEVSMERMESDECNKAHDELTRVMGYPPADAFMALEIGGANGVVNLEVAAAHGVACVDADFMGRAYPTDWQTTANVYGDGQGSGLLPATIASGDGSSMTMTGSRTDKLVDRALRAAVVEMGCRAGKAGPLKSAKMVQDQAIVNTVSLAWLVGRSIALERSIKDKAKRIIDAVGGSESAKILAEGKITSVERVLKTGHTYGIVEIDGVLEDGSKAIIRIPFKNENAYVEATNSSSGEVSILAAVPDLIAVLDSETGTGLGTPEYKYGLKVTVIAIAASPRWTDTPRGLELGGPGSMGFDYIKYVPIGKYSKPASVIETYS